MELAVMKADVGPTGHIIPTGWPAGETVHAAPMTPAGAMRFASLMLISVAQTPHRAGRWQYATKTRPAVQAHTAGMKKVVYIVFL